MDNISHTILCAENLNRPNKTKPSTSTTTTTTTRREQQKYFKFSKCDEMSEVFMWNVYMHVKQVLNEL